MSQISFDEEQTYRRAPGATQKSGALQPLRSFLVSSGVPANSVDYVLLAGVGVLVLISAYLIVSAGARAPSYMPSPEEIQRMNSRPLR